MTRDHVKHVAKIIELDSVLLRSWEQVVPEFVCSADEVDILSRFQRGLGISNVVRIALETWQSKTSHQATLRSCIEILLRKNFNSTAGK